MPSAAVSRTYTCKLFLVLLIPVGLERKVWWPVIGSYTHMSEQRLDLGRALMCLRRRTTSPPRDVSSSYRLKSFAAQHDM